MLRCPHCGTTAQVRLVWEDRDDYGTKKIKEFVCGCGCHFEVIFRATDINILPAED